MKWGLLNFDHLKFGCFLDILDPPQLHTVIRLQLKNITFIQTFLVTHITNI